MTKIKFLISLRDKLSGLPESEIEERLKFYCEMIEDRVEDGLTEEEAVRAVGTVDDIAKEIIDGTPLITIVKEKIKPKRALKGWEIALIAVGSPVWGALLVALLAVTFSLYACIWSAAVSLWAVFAALAVSGAFGAFAGLLFVFKGNVLSGIATVGVSLVCISLAIFLFFGCMAATKGTVALTKKILKGIKGCFVKKEEAK